MLVGASRKMGILTIEPQAPFDIFGTGRAGGWGVWRVIVWARANDFTENSAKAMQAETSLKYWRVGKRTILWCDTSEGVGKDLVDERLKGLGS
jgi:hypothetical protein